jgi:hypothetical protein
MNTLIIRPYITDDYEKVAELYRETEMPGSRFDMNRDSKQRLQARIEHDPDSILIGEQEGEVVASVSLIEDGRVAWLFRFRVREIEGDEEIAAKLLDKAIEVFQGKGHHEVLVYTPVGETKFEQRYLNLGFTKGHDYTCFWKEI